MEGMNNLSAADVAAVTRGNCGYGYGGGCGYGFGGEGLWLFAILALMGGGFGGWGNRWGNGFADGRCATVEDLNNSANFTRLENQVRANENTIQQGFTNTGNGICQLGYQLATDFGALEKQVASCCCDVNRNIDSVRFDIANYSSAINANTTAQVQKVLDKLCADNTAALQARIQQLELQQAMCNVVRFPNQFAYNAGFPFFGNGCGCCGNNF